MWKYKTGKRGEEGEVKANKRGEVGTSSDNCQVSKENWECKLLQFLSSEKLERKQREWKFMTNQQFLFLVWKVWQGFWYLCDRLGKMSMVFRRRSRFWCKEVRVNLAENANGNRATVQLYIVKCKVYIVQLKCTRCAEIGHFSEKWCSKCTL